MRHVRFSVLFAGVVAIGALSAASLGNAEVITTCVDDGQTYSDTCPNTTTNGRCINTGTGTQAGCCNKGTCSGSVCNLGGGIDAACLNDGNQCTDDGCVQNVSTHQAICSHQPSASGASCNNDNNVCTIEQCNGASSCVTTGTTNTCAAEQASNPAPQPICAPWSCDPTLGCDKRAVPNSPVTNCNDGKDCTSGDICVNGVCGKGSSGTNLPEGTPCRDDDTGLGNGDNRTWCQAGHCNGGETCVGVSNIPDGQPCGPNPCTNATCVGSGANGACTISSCKVGQTFFCGPCGIDITCVDFLQGNSANQANPCGCRTFF